MLYAAIAAIFIVPNAMVVALIVRAAVRTMAEIQDNRGLEPVAVTTERN